MPGSSACRLLRFRPQEMIHFRIVRVWYIMHRYHLLKKVCDRQRKFCQVFWRYENKAVPLVKRCHSGAIFIQHLYTVFRMDGDAAIRLRQGKRFRAVKSPLKPERRAFRRKQYRMLLRRLIFSRL